MTDPSPYLRSIHLPKDHRAHVFVPVQHFKVMRQLVRLWGAYSELFSSKGDGDKSKTIEALWQDAAAADSYVARAFFKRKATHVELAGYCVLEGVADPRRIPEGVLSTQVEMPADFPTQSTGQFFDLIHKTFPGERKLRSEGERDRWNPIVNTGNEIMDRDNRDAGVARYSSTNSFLMEDMEQGEELVPLAQRRAYLDTWVGLLLSALNLDADGAKPMYFPRSGGRFLITGKRCVRQVCHNDFPVRTSAHAPGYFAIVTSSESTRLWLSPFSNAFVFFPENQKESIRKGLRLRALEIPPLSIFIGHGHLQHAGAEWGGSHCPRYHIYLTPEDLQLPDAIVFAYGDALQAVEPSGGYKISNAEKRHRVSVQQSRTSRTSKASKVSKSRSVHETSDAQSDDDDNDDGDDGDDDFIGDEEEVPEQNEVGDIADV